jgi:transmembrane sensor
MDDLIDWPAVLRYLAGESSPTEQLRIATWIDADPERHAYVESLRAIDEADTRGANEYDATAARSKLWTRLGLSTSSSAATTGSDANRVSQLDGQIGRRHLRSAEAGAPPRPWPRGAGRSARVRGWWLAGKVAAAMAMLVGVAFAWGLRDHSSRGEPTSREYASFAGQRMTITLADGTRLTLAPASRVHVPLDYGRAERTLTLEGEGYFRVAHDPARPFIVRAGTAVTTDIGTAFDVRAYVGDTVVRVAVAEGRVLVRGSHVGAGAHLTAGQVTVVDAHGRVNAPEMADAAVLTAWTRGELVFRDARLADVVTDLSRWYGVPLALRDPILAGRRFTGTFTSESVHDAIAVLCAGLGACRTPADLLSIDSMLPVPAP